MAVAFLFNDEQNFLFLHKKSTIDHKDISQQNVTASTKEIIKHYFDEGKQTDQAYVGSMKSCNGDPQISWTILDYWELPITESIFN